VREALVFGAGYLAAESVTYGNWKLAFLTLLFLGVASRLKEKKS
jgi:hypothetical protein